AGCAGSGRAHAAAVDGTVRAAKAAEIGSQLWVVALAQSPPEMHVEKGFSAAHGVRRRSTVCRVGLLGLARIVEVVLCAWKYDQFQIAAVGAGFLGEFFATLGRDFLVGR